ncbi:hypothetical protein ACJJTC_009410 [Scirpophaga incertulas]
MATHRAYHRAAAGRRRRRGDAHILSTHVPTQVVCGTHPDSVATTEISVLHGDQHPHARGTHSKQDGLFSVSRSCRKSVAYLKASGPLGADSLEYLSVEGLVSAVHYNMKTVPSDGLGGHCTACLTGDYPGGLPDDIDW